MLIDRRFRRVVPAGLAIALTFALSAADARGDLALEGFSGGTLTLNTTLDLPRTAGWSFTVGDLPLLVDALGVFDVNGDGLASAVTVGLWDEATATLLVSVTLPAGMSGTEDSGFRFLPVSPVVLAANQTYVLGAELVTNGERAFFDVSSFTTASDIVYGSALASAPDTGFAFPDQLAPVDNGVFGPNLAYTVIPEPSTLTLGGIGGVVLAACRSRRPGRIV